MVRAALIGAAYYLYASLSKSHLPELHYEATKAVDTSIQNLIDELEKTPSTPDPDSGPPTNDTISALASTARAALMGHLGDLDPNVLFSLDSRWGLDTFSLPMGEAWGLSFTQWPIFKLSFDSPSSPEASSSSLNTPSYLFFTARRHLSSWGTITWAYARFAFTPVITWVEALLLVIFLLSTKRKREKVWRELEKENRRLVENKQHMQAKEAPQDEEEEMDREQEMFRLYSLWHSDDEEMHSDDGYQRDNSVLPLLLGCLLLLLRNTQHQQETTQSSGHSEWPLGFGNQNSTQSLEDKGSNEAAAAHNHSFIISTLLLSLGPLPFWAAHACVFTPALSFVDALLLFAYFTGVFDAQKLEKRCEFLEKDNKRDNRTLRGTQLQEAGRRARERREALEVKNMGKGRLEKHVHELEEKLKVIERERDGKHQRCEEQHELLQNLTMFHRWYEAKKEKECKELKKKVKAGELEVEDAKRRMLAQQEETQRENDQRRPEHVHIRTLAESAERSMSENRQRATHGMREVLTFVLQHYKDLEEMCQRLSEENERKEEEIMGQKQRRGVKVEAAKKVQEEEGGSEEKKWPVIPYIFEPGSSGVTIEFLLRRFELSTEDRHRFMRSGTAPLRQRERPAILRHFSAPSLYRSRSLDVYFNARKEKDSGHEENSTHSTTSTRRPRFSVGSIQSSGVTYMYTNRCTSLRSPPEAQPQQYLAGQRNSITGPPTKQCTSSYVSPKTAVKKTSNAYSPKKEVLPNHEVKKGIRDNPRFRTAAREPTGTGQTKRLPKAGQPHNAAGHTNGGGGALLSARGYTIGHTKFAPPVFAAEAVRGGECGTSGGSGGTSGHAGSAKTSLFCAGRESGGGGQCQKPPPSPRYPNAAAAAAAAAAEKVKRKCKRDGCIPTPTSMTNGGSIINVILTPRVESASLEKNGECNAAQE